MDFGWQNSGYRRRVQKVDRGKFTENVKKKTGFGLKTGEVCGRTWPIKLYQITQRSATRHFHVGNRTTTLWIWNGMTVPVMTCRAIKFANLIGKWLKERAYWRNGWCAIGDDICNCVGHHVMHLLPYLLPNSLCFINVRTSFHKYRKSRCLLFLCYQHLNKNVVNR